jgi:hypothetical protein
MWGTGNYIAGASVRAVSGDEHAVFKGAGGDSAMSGGLEAQDPSCHQQWGQGICTEETFDLARSAPSSCTNGSIQLTFARLATGTTVRFFAL